MSKEESLEDSPQTREWSTHYQNLQLVNSFYDINPQMSPDEVFSLVNEYRKYIDSNKDESQRDEEAKLRNARLLEYGISPDNCILFTTVQPMAANIRHPNVPLTDVDMEKWIKKVPEGLRLFAIQGEINVLPLEMKGKYYDSQSFWEIYMFKPGLS
jgi:hypothetical protein